MTRSSRLLMLTLSALFAFIISLSGCTSGTFEDAGEEVDETLSEVEEETEDAADEIEEEAEELEDSVQS